LQLGDFNARVDYGIPLVSVSGDKNTWQENGIYFTIQYGSF
jgi:hemolysin activation/secretion protein